MRVMLSYSRHDSAVADRLCQDLERHGHHVWIDREDIRASVRWRASIAQAIKDHDQVLLLVSDHSLASVNVAQELNIAAEYDRPIVPLALAPAELTPEFAYELAGVQRIRFYDRSWEESVAEVLELLAAAPAATTSASPAAGGVTAPLPPPSHPPTVASPVPSPAAPTVGGPGQAAGGRPGRPAWLLPVAVAAAVVVAVVGLVVATGGDGGSGGSVAGTRVDNTTAVDDTAVDDTAVDDTAVDDTAVDDSTVDDSMVDETSVAAEPVRVVPTGFAWYAGVRFSPIEVLFFPDSAAVIVDYEVLVMQTEALNLLTLIDGLALQLPSGATLPATLTEPPSGSIPGDGSIARVVVTYPDLPSWFTFDDAQLVFGRVTEQQWAIPLIDGASGIGTDPTRTELDAVVEAEGFTFDVDHVDVVPWGCAGADDGNAGGGRSYYGPIARGRSSLVLVGTVSSTVDHRGGNTAGTVVLTTPSGQRVATSTLFGVYNLGTIVTGVPVCFALTVDVPDAGGTYQLEWTSARGGVQTYEFALL